MHVSDPGCVSSANHSAEWLKDNFGFFSRFASVTDFYLLHSNFSGVSPDDLKNLRLSWSLHLLLIISFSVVFLLQLEVLHLLTPDQTAEMLLLPLPAPPEKHVVIDRVFDFLLESPEERNFASVLHSLVKLTKKVTFFSDTVTLTLLENFELFWMINCKIFTLSGRSTVWCLQTNVSTLRRFYNLTHCSLVPLILFSYFLYV